MNSKLTTYRKTLEKYDQLHLLDFFYELSDIEQNELLNQINSIDFEKVHNLYIQSNLDDSISFDRISPLPYISKSDMSKNTCLHFSSIGESIIKNGKLAVITLAGGQGTRLGYKGPKGLYEIDVPPRKSLFEFICDDLKKVKNTYGIYISWYIMTSTTNNMETKEYFKSHNFFGYPEDKIHFFIQDTFPIIDIHEKIILDTPSSIKIGSNGNGDVFKAFASAGLIQDLDKNHIDWIFIGSIDNILAKWADPLFLGLAVEGSYSVASKSIRKSSYNITDWVFANIDGRPNIIDPKNLPDNIIMDPNQVLYNQMNILSHLFTVDAFKSLVDIPLPYHRAFKKNNFINKEGMKEVPSRPNSFKFEKFIFDAFNMFDDLLLLEVDPLEEFAPIKAFTGSATPETALELYKRYHNKF